MTMDIWERAYDWYVSGRITYEQYEAICLKAGVEPMPEAYVDEGSDD